MTRMAYCVDIASRSFFIFLVADLLWRRWWLAILLAVVINLVYEFTLGKKYWRAWRQLPRPPRRSFKVICRQLWQRVFARERTKGLVGAGLTIFILSWFVRFNVYYLVCACLVFTLAAISRFAPPVKSATLTCEQNADPASSPPTRDTAPSK